jgi:hypothetical protein
VQVPRGGVLVALHHRRLLAISAGWRGEQSGWADTVSRGGPTGAKGGRFSRGYCWSGAPIHEGFAESGSHQDALQTIFSARLEVLYLPLARFLWTGHTESEPINALGEC